MRKFFQYLRVIFTAGFAVLYYSLFYFHRYAKNPKKYPLEKRYQKVQKLMRIVLKHFHCDVHVEGLENVEKIQGKALFISNHLSEVDPLAIVSLLKNPLTFAAKEESLKMPFVGQALVAIEGIPLDRGNIMNQIAEIKAIVEMIKSPDEPNIAIFAEGKRNKDPKSHCLEFKGGSVKMASMANVPIIPVSLYGTFRVFDFKCYLKRYPIYVKFGEPIMPSEYKDINSITLADTLRKQIDDDVDHYRLLDKEEVYKQHLSKKWKEKETEVDKIPSAS